MGSGSAGPRVEGWKIGTALAVLYLSWGSWFLFTSVAVETIPPVLLMSVRLFFAGLVFAAFIGLRNGFHSLFRVSRHQLFGAFVGGTLWTGAGVLYTAAERTVPSAMAALLCAAYPFGVLILRKVLGEKVPWVSLVAVTVGFIGLAILLIPENQTAGSSTIDLILMVIGIVFASFGTIALGRMAQPKGALLGTTYINLFVGVAFTIVALAIGEGEQLNLSAISLDSWLSVFALLITGQVGFILYFWLVRNAGVSIAATEGYASTVVAVILGVVILNDPMTALGILGAAIIVGSVWFLIRSEGRTEVPSPAVLEEVRAVEAETPARPSNSSDLAA